MSETVMKKMKSKKSKKESKAKLATPSDSDSSDEELDLMKECHPIAHYINDRPQMVAEMFSVIKGAKLKAMLPPIMKDYDVEKLKLKCLDQLLGMSDKRILSILDGEILESSSESDVPSDESNESSSDSSDTTDKAKSVQSRMKKKKPLKSDPDLPKQPERAHNLWNPEDPTPPENQGKTLLEILELEMRARAIRALLKQNDTPEKGETSQIQPVISAEIDLTEDDFPTVVKKEVSSEQEKDFTEKIQEAKAHKKQMAENKSKVANKKQLLTEHELRNKLIKKKTYRTREQRLENIEPDVPPEREIDKDPDPEIIPVEVVKVEPTEIVIEDPEEGEASSDDEPAPVVVKQEVEQSADMLVEVEASITPDGERITAIDEGEFVANTDVEFAQPQSDISEPIGIQQVDLAEEHCVPLVAGDLGHNISVAAETVILEHQLSNTLASNDLSIVEATPDAGSAKNQPKAEVFSTNKSNVDTYIKTERYSKLALELKHIEKQIDRRTQLPLITDIVFPQSSDDAVVTGSSKVLVLRIGQRGKEMQEYAVATSIPPVFDVPDSEDDDDDDIMIIEDEDCVEIEVNESAQNANEPVNLADDACATWKSRWLSKDKVQTIVKSSKICALVRKRLMSKKAALKAQKSVESLTPPEVAQPIVEEPVVVAVPPAIEGSVSEYERIAGKRVIETDEIVSECLTKVLDLVAKEDVENNSETPG